MKLSGSSSIPGTLGIAGTLCIAGIAGKAGIEGIAGIAGAAGTEGIAGVGIECTAGMGMGGIIPPMMGRTGTAEKSKRSTIRRCTVSHVHSMPHREARQSWAHWLLFLG